MTISNNNFDNAEDLKSKIFSLKRELISFKIIDRQGINRGIVKDIYYDADGDLNLLLELADVGERLSLRRLGHEDICQVDVRQKSIVTNLSNQQLECLPIYQPVPPSIKDALAESTQFNDCEMNPHSNSQSSIDSEDIKLSLLEEKLRVVRQKQKIGEVVVRKQVETRIAKIPLRREKLIIERVGKNPQQLTEVVISEEKIDGFKYDELEPDNSQFHTAKSKYVGIKQAQNILNEIEQLAPTSRLKIRLEIITDSSDLQKLYRNICDRQK